MTSISIGNQSETNLQKTFCGSNGSNMCPSICKNVKGCSHKFEIWHADQSAHALQKTRKQLFFVGAACLPNISKSKIIKEIFEANFEWTSSTGPNILFTSCQEPAGIGTDSIVNFFMPRKGVISYPNINKK